ncbi:sperm-associated antigen 7 homolog [Tubulanus polymorphus]|uniref:sperm-associated antigen 7 homolog n=1 Tax=Tubulanus polymorphus TaxID=672921 RepID=UPI003DA3CB40
MDLLGSILGSMEKPPAIADDERKKRKAEKERLEKQQKDEKARLNQFRDKNRKAIHDFIKDSTKENHRFSPMDKVYRAILHEIADTAGLTSFSFGLEETDRYVMVWKKEFAPSDDELLARRKGDEWNEEKALEIAQQREQEKLENELQAKSKRNKDKMVPASNYQERYERLIGKEAAKDAARLTTANRQYGNVPSENKRDQRTIEQVMADSRAKKKLRTANDSDVHSSTNATDECNSTEPDGNT